MFLLCCCLLACGYIQAQDTARVDSSFHLYLLIGQSNMAGRGMIDTADNDVQQGILMLDRQNVWVPAKDPLHFDKKMAGVGPGMSFAQAMLTGNAGIRIGLIPCAVGGTSIGKWEPGAYDENTATHPYDDMEKRLRIALRYGVLKGILWHQGEGNSSPQSIRKYPAQLQELIGRLRGIPGAAGVPFVAGELGRFGPTRFAFNEMIREMPQSVPRMKVVSSEGLQHKGDNLHFDAPSARELGKRYAEAMQELQAKP